MAQNYSDVYTHMEHIINPFSQKQREGLEWKTNPGMWLEKPSVCHSEADKSLVTMQL